MPKLVSIHAELTGVTELVEVRPVLDGLLAGRGPMSAATAGSVCLSEKRLLFSAQAETKKEAGPSAHPKQTH